ncbi:hypothetical protein T439DRAFT_352604 [Meredithblackwellia eburnea MCA 4105]
MVVSPLHANLQSLSPLPPTLQPRRRVRRLNKSLTAPVDGSALGLTKPPDAHLHRIDRVTAASYPPLSMPSIPEKIHIHREPFKRTFPFPPPPSQRLPPAIVDHAGHSNGAADDNSLLKPNSVNEIEKQHPENVPSFLPSSFSATKSSRRQGPQRSGPLHRRNQSSLRQPSSSSNKGTTWENRFKNFRQDLQGKGRGAGIEANLHRPLGVVEERDLGGLALLGAQERLEEEKGKYADAELLPAFSFRHLSPEPSSPSSPLLEGLARITKVQERSLSTFHEPESIGLGIISEELSSTSSSFTHTHLPAPAEEHLAGLGIVTLPLNGQRIRRGFSESASDITHDIDDNIDSPPRFGSPASDGGHSVYYSNPPSPSLSPSPTFSSLSERDSPSFHELDDLYDGGSSAPIVLPTMPASPKSPVKKIARLPGSFPRRLVRRVYPRPPSLDLRPIPFRSELVVRSPVVFEPLVATPDLSVLPGAFVASPVLPTVFADFNHSPLPTPPARFAKLRRSATETGSMSPITQSGSLSPAAQSASYSTAQGSTSTQCPPSSAPPSPFASVFSSIPASPLGTPTLSASHTFASTHVDDLEPSAPSTPVPDAHSSSFATPVPTTNNSSSGAQPILFDAALASTVIGAIVCLGAMSWLAFVYIRRKVPKPGKAITGPTSNHDKDGGESPEKLRAFVHRADEYPAPPPIARLSFQRRNDRNDYNDGFRAEFDQWVDCEEYMSRPSHDQSDTHERYTTPEPMRRSGSFGRSDYSRRTSHASQETSSTRPIPRRRSSLRTSTPISIADSTFTRRSTQSSKTSHGVSPTPPRLPSPVGLRYSGDAALYFSTPPETPTKSRKFNQTSNEEPPVPVVPVDFRKGITSPTRPRTNRSRSSSKSSVSTKASKSTKSSTRTRTEPTEDIPANPTTSTPTTPSSARARKLEKRRATIDGGVLTDDVQGLLFQAQFAIAGAEEALARENSPAASGDANEDLFSATVGSQLAARLSSRPVRKSSITKKARPVTMPAIVVSDHPQELVPPPTPQKIRAVMDDGADSEVDPRMSVKTFDTMPWLSHSPSTVSAFTTNFPRDDCSILDPDMRSQRHISVDSSKTATESVAGGRFSTDSAAIRQLVNIPLDELCTPRSDDDRSLTSVDNSDLDTDDEQLLRLRRRTLLYSVYQQRGISVEPVTGSDIFKSVDPDTGVVETLNSGVMTKRQSIVSSFPSPPTPSVATLGTITPVEGKDADVRGDSSSVAEVDLERFSLDRIESTESLRVLARSKTFDTMASTHTESDITSIFCSADGHDEFIPTHPIPPLPSPPSAAPPRPPKAPWRNSRTFDSVDTDLSSLPSEPHITQITPSRIPLATRATPTPSISAPPASSSPPGTPIRSFAADLQASVGSPAAGYDSDTLMCYTGIRSFGKLTDSIYSTQSASMESLEEVAIARAEAVHVGSRAGAFRSGIPTYARGKQFRRTGPIGSSYESDESTYDESDADLPIWTARLEERLSTVME